jgi:hypothetical protein
MENINNAETAELILKDFELAPTNKPLDEAAMLIYLSDVIAYMLEHKMDYLMSLLYRLDIDEEKINRSLMPGNPDPANVALAKIVWQRQLKRVETKNTYKVQNPNNWNWDTE